MDENDEDLHDEFDFDLIFAEYNDEAPGIEEVISSARKFGDSHRFLINKLILEPSMSLKKMNSIFAKHFTLATLKKHPDAFMKIESNPQKAKELAKILVKTINNESGKGRKNFKPWRLVTCTDEKTPTEFVTMTGCTRNSSIISETSDLTKPERALLLAILEEMIVSDGTVDISWVHGLIKQDPHKLTGVQCDNFVQNMRRQKYFSMDPSTSCLEITPRLLVELEPWLRAKFVGDLRICDLCRKIVSRPVFTAECKSCRVMSHFNCFKNATVISNQDSVECQQCQKMLSLDQVLEQIEENKTNGHFSHSRRQSLAQDDVSDKDEDVGDVTMSQRRKRRIDSDSE